MSGRLRVALTPGDFSGRAAKFARPTDDGVVLGSVAPLDESDVALFPFELGVTVRTPDDLSRLSALVADNARAGRRTVMHLVHDHVEPLDVGQPDAVVLRTSMMSSKPYRSEHSMPVSVDDPWPDGTMPGAAVAAGPVRQLHGAGRPDDPGLLRRRPGRHGR